MRSLDKSLLVSKRTVTVRVPNGLRRSQVERVRGAEGTVLFRVRPPMDDQSGSGWECTAWGLL